MNVHREYAALTPAEQDDFNANRLDLPSLPLARNRNPPTDSRVEELNEEVDEPPSGSLLPNRQLPTLREKMIEAAAKRKIADRDRVLVQALNAVQALDSESSYEEFLPILEPFHLTDEETIQVIKLLADAPFSATTNSTSSRMNLSLDNFQLSLPMDHKKVEQLRAFLYRSDTSSVKMTDVISKTCFPLLNNKICTSFTQLGITEAQALLWETKSLKQIADYLLILYPKDISTKSDTLQSCSLITTYSTS
jgi:hypothetical protein